MTTIKGATGLHPDDKILSNGQKELGLNHLGEFIGSIVDDQGNTITEGTILDAETLNVILYLLSDPIVDAGLKADRIDKTLLTQAILTHVTSHMSTRVFKGMFAWSMLSSNEVPNGWAVCNGAGISGNTPQGQALSNMTSEFKKLWEIGYDVSNNIITKPNLMAINENGRGVHIRGGDDTNMGTLHKQYSLVGIHNHTGHGTAHDHAKGTMNIVGSISSIVADMGSNSSSSFSGAFGGDSFDGQTLQRQTSENNFLLSNLYFDANSKNTWTGRSSIETPPITIDNYNPGEQYNTAANVTMIPLIYLGV